MVWLDEHNNGHWLLGHPRSTLLVGPFVVVSVFTTLLIGPLSCLPLDYGFGQPGTLLGALLAVSLDPLWFLSRGVF
jgi:hypothetical protein